jgi:ribonucleotide monophosphatase NagD (HAD superfamily)
MALDAGMASAVVLTGETTAEASADEPASNKPTYVLERVDQLIPRRLWEEFGWSKDEEQQLRDLA